MKSTPGYKSEMEAEYRVARSSEQVRVAEDLLKLFTTAGVLVVDAQGHGIISAKIASTVHDTFHAFMLSELDRHGKTTSELLEKINLRLAQSVTARNALGISEKENAREIATMLYGEVHPYGHFRFVNFGHPPPLVFSAEYRKFMEIDKSRMVQFLALGSADSRGSSGSKAVFLHDFRQKRANSSDVAEITLMSPGDILFLYTDGVYDGSDQEERQQLEAVMRKNYLLPAKDICNALLEYAQRKTIGCARLANRTVLTIRPCLSSSGAEKRTQEENREQAEAQRISTLFRESPSRRRHLLVVLPRSSLKRPHRPGRSPSLRLHPRWQSA